MPAQDLKGLEPGGASPATFAEEAGMRKQVLLSAAALFAERGYYATRICDIAEAAGLSKPALYHYVRSKDQLLFDLLMETLGEYVTGARGVIYLKSRGPRATLAALAATRRSTTTSPTRRSCSS